MAIERWYVFQTRHNTEFLAERQLRRQHFETFVPSVMVDKTRIGVVIGREKRALFRNYGFVRFNAVEDNWKPICSTYGVRRLFSTTPECPLSVPIGVVESLQEAMQLPLVPGQALIVEGLPIPLLPNEEAEVIDGPFAGRIGIVQSTTPKRTTLLLDILQGQVAVTFRLANVRRVDKSYAAQTP